MAIGGKSLGIVSGLAVGLTSGVILAALNPVIPRTDSTQIADAPEASQIEDVKEPSNDPALPKLSMVDTAPTVEEAVIEPEQEPEVEEPAVVAEISEPPKTGDADTLEPVVTPEKQAIALPIDADVTTEIVDPVEPTVVAADSQPQLSTDPAKAIELAEPTLQTESPDVVVAALVTTETLETADLSEPEADQEPTELSPVDDTVAALPVIENPAPPKANVADPAETPTEDGVAADVIEEEKPNTSGTFKTTGGSIITQGSRLPKIGGEQKKSRFPTIGSSSNITEAPEEQAVEEPLPNPGALIANANEFPVTDDPLMSIILIDDGKIAAQLPSLQGLNLPLTIAVSLDEEDAQSRARTYRDAGFEVLTMAPRNVELSLSGGQSNEQVAELMTRYFEIMPESIGLIDRPAANLQKDQRLLRSVVKSFAETGHGIITYAGGLNGTKRIADQQDVSNGTVFRFLDKSGEAGVILTQQLDRAAREARNKGSVIIMATASKSTLGTLVGWSLSSKARAVTLAPVSASLLKN